MIKDCHNTLSLICNSSKYSKHSYLSKKISLWNLCTFYCRTLCWGSTYCQGIKFLKVLLRTFYLESVSVMYLSWKHWSVYMNYSDFQGYFFSPFNDYLWSKSQQARSLPVQFANRNNRVRPNGPVQVNGSANASAISSGYPWSLRNYIWGLIHTEKNWLMRVIFKLGGWLRTKCVLKLSGATEGLWKNLMDFKNILFDF